MMSYGITDPDQHGFSSLLVSSLALSHYVKHQWNSYHNRIIFIPKYAFENVPNLTLFWEHVLRMSSNCGAETAVKSISSGTFDWELTVEVDNDGKVGMSSAGKLKSFPSKISWMEVIVFIIVLWFKFVFGFEKIMLWPQWLRKGHDD